MVSAPETIVRSLSISNGTPSRPTRRWRKMTGPWLSTLMAIAQAAMSGDADDERGGRDRDVEQALHRVPSAFSHSAGVPVRR